MSRIEAPRLCYAPRHANPEDLFFPNSNIDVSLFQAIALGLVPGKGKCPECWAAGSLKYEHEHARCSRRKLKHKVSFGDDVCQSCGIHVRQGFDAYGVEGLIGLHPIGQVGDDCPFKGVPILVVCAALKWKTLANTVDGRRQPFVMHGEPQDQKKYLPWIKNGFGDKHYMNPIMIIVNTVAELRGCPWTMPIHVSIPETKNSNGVFLAAWHNNVWGFKHACTSLRRGRGMCAICWVKGVEYNHEIEDCISQNNTVLQMFQFPPEVCNGCGVHLHQGLKDVFGEDGDETHRFHPAGRRDADCPWRNTCLAAISTAIHSPEILQEIAYTAAPHHLPVKVGDAAYYADWLEGNDNPWYYWMNPVMLALKAITNVRGPPN